MKILVLLRYGIRAIEHSDVCIVMVDAFIGFDAQDLNIFHLAEKNKKGIVVLVNKWDILENKESMTMDHYRKMTLLKLHHLQITHNLHFSFNETANFQSSKMAGSVQEKYKNFYFRIKQ